MMNQVKNESEQVSEQMCKRETEKRGCRQKYVDDEKEWKWKRIKRGERCKESRDKERGRQTQREKERLLVSSFLLVIGFSDWSKLFFSILLLSLSHRHLFSPSMA